jgi:hypothetical protein
MNVTFQINSSTWPYRSWALTSTARNVVMRTVARAEPSSIVARLSNRHTSQVGTHAKHDEPLWLLRPLLVRLGVPERLPVRVASLVNLALRAVADEHRLSTPFDDDVLALRDGVDVDLDLGHGEDVGRCRHCTKELGHSALCDGGGEDTHAADHHVGDGTVGGLGGCLVVAEVGDVVGVASNGRGGEETLLGEPSRADYKEWRAVSGYMKVSGRGYAYQ